jgi:hypothetical protein
MLPHLHWNQCPISSEYAGIKDLVSVLAVDFLSIAVFQGDLDRDIRLKVNLIAHSRAPFASAAAAGGGC